MSVHQNACQLCRCSHFPIFPVFSATQGGEIDLEKAAPGGKRLILAELQAKVLTRIFLLNPRGKDFEWARLRLTPTS
jgi:hypothetical protein